MSEHRTKVLIIEDDRDIAELIQYNLTQAKIDSQIVSSGSLGLQTARRDPPDLILLDLMLPDCGGMEVCRSLKEDPRTRRIPIVILTAKGEEIDRVVGFEVGADDYITKPFSPRELLLRIRAILRRVRGEPPEKTAPEQFGSLRIDPEKFEVTVQKNQVRLTPLEFRLLQYLLTNRGRIATREILLDRVWGMEADLTTRTVDTHIKRLREKLGLAGDYIETIRGVGYRFKEIP